MIIYYLDASAWIKRYCSEEGTPEVGDLFVRGPAIGCAALGLVEVVSTLARKAKAGEMDAADMRRKCQEAERDFDGFHRVFLTPSLLKSACRCASRYGLRGADTVHLASCLELGRLDWGQEAEVVMVSSDGELLAGAADADLRTRNPEVEPVVID